jgi:hypothetical protein
MLTMISAISSSAFEPMGGLCVDRSPKAFQDDHPRYVVQRQHEHGHHVEVEHHQRHEHEEAHHHPRMWWE